MATGVVQATKDEGSKVLLERARRAIDADLGHQVFNLDDPRDLEKSTKAEMERRGLIWDLVPHWVSYPLVPTRTTIRVLQGRIYGDGRTEFIEASDELGFWRDARNRVLDWDKASG
jgi:hypothetical protein